MGRGAVVGVMNRYEGRDENKEQSLGRCLLVIFSITRIANAGSFGVYFRKRTMKCWSAESVRAAVNKLPARGQRHMRVLTHEAPC
jgi:hypothetical protein